MDAIENVELWSSFQQGDQKAFETIYAQGDRYVRQEVRHQISLTSPFFNDVVQEAWVSLLSRVRLLVFSSVVPYPPRFARWLRLEGSRAARRFLAQERKVANFVRADKELISNWNPARQCCLRDSVQELYWWAWDSSKGIPLLPAILADLGASNAQIARISKVPASRLQTRVAHVLSEYHGMSPVSTLSGTPADSEWRVSFRRSLTLEESLAVIRDRIGDSKRKQIAEALMRAPFDELTLPKIADFAQTHGFVFQDVHRVIEILCDHKIGLWERAFINVETRVVISSEEVLWRLQMGINDSDWQDWSSKVRVVWFRKNRH